MPTNHQVVTFDKALQQKTGNWFHKKTINMNFKDVQYLLRLEVENEKREVNIKYKTINLTENNEGQLTQWFLLKQVFRPEKM